MGTDSQNSHNLGIFENELGEGGLTDAKFLQTFLLFSIVSHKQVMSFCFESYTLENYC